MKIIDSIRSTGAIARSLAITVAFALVASMATVPAFAETVKSDPNWTVTFTSGQQMESNFTGDDMEMLTRNIQPGDTAEITVNIKDSNSNPTTWYMKNEILQSLEDAAESATGGAYEYDLRYIGPDGSTTSLFSSEKLGGDDATGTAPGLREANSATDDYFLLGTLNSGQTGKVQLAITLDGETQGNAYQSTLASLAMDFAVEMGSNPQRNLSNYYSLLQTGDNALSMVPIYAACAIAGLLLLIIVLLLRRRRNDEEEEGVR